MIMFDPYVYEDTEVLINKLGIRNYDELRQAEADLCFVKLISIDRVQHKDFNLEYLKAIHRYILEDVFEWAGEIRTVKIVKEEDVLGGDTVRYADPKDIKEKSEKTIEDIKSLNWGEMSIHERACNFSRLFARLWQVHPFRDGNTRSVICFASEFLKSNDLGIDMDVLLKNFGYVRKAFVKASDGEYSDYSYLERIIEDAMRIYETEKKVDEELERE